MAKNTESLTVRQQVWVAAWTAAIQSAKYNPSEEANACLEAFDKKFGNSVSETIKNSTVEKNINIITE
jgi:hypothetical protein